MIPAASAALTWPAAGGSAVAPGELAVVAPGDLTVVARGEGAAMADGRGPGVARGRAAVVADRLGPDVVPGGVAVVADRRGLSVAPGGVAVAAGAAISSGACAVRAAFSAAASAAVSRATTTTGEEANSSRVNAAVSTSGAVLASTDVAGEGLCVSGAGSRRAPPTASVRKVALTGRGPVIVVHAATTATTAHSPATRTGVLSFGGRGPERTRLLRRCSRGLLVGSATLCGLSH